MYEVCSSIIIQQNLSVFGNFLQVSIILHLNNLVLQEIGGDKVTKQIETKV